MSAEYNITFDWNRISTLGKVKVLVEQVVGSPSQEAISQAVEDYIEAHPGSLSPLSPAVKAALLQIAEKVAYIDEHGQDYYDELAAALNSKEVVSISAIFAQEDAVIYDTDSLDTLKQYLTVTANYGDGTSGTVMGYTLSGTLEVGTSTITVTYQGQTAMFNVVVSDAHPLLYSWDYTKSLTDEIQGVISELVNGIERTDAGLLFSGNHQYVIVGRNILAYNKTIEVDFTDVSYAAGDHTACFWHLWNGTDNPQSGYYSTFGMRYGSSASQRKLGAITTKTQSWDYANPARTRTFLDGKTGTLKQTISSTGGYQFYLDGVNLGISGVSIDSQEKIKAMTLGCHDQGSYVSFYNMTITAVRIYEGVK